jgi:polyphosphate kinase 2
MTIDNTQQEEMMRRLREDLLDSYDEELEMELEERNMEELEATGKPRNEADRLARRTYFQELFRLQGELVKLQDWVVASKHKVVILFEGRDAAGKGGVIKRITQRLNPRVARVAALPAPNDRERTQWYFQRYVSHLPAAGEMVLFDRSWYNRAGVERVMGFCSDDEYEEFFRTVPEFEKMLARSGIQLIKYWFSITDDEQHSRFLGRIHDPLKQWKLSPMDLESRVRWEEYTKAKETMLERTHIPGSTLVDRAGSGQEDCAPELHRPPAEPDPLYRGGTEIGGAASTRVQRGLQPPPGAGGDVRAGTLLTVLILVAAGIYIQMTH